MELSRGLHICRCKFALSAAAYAILIKFVGWNASRTIHCLQLFINVAFRLPTDWEGRSNRQPLLYDGSLSLNNAIIT
uniref:Uncharacterized protein n=1 Tax=Anopheles dirus TaxID=7168 RepID=A0A182NYE6_9DIPT